MEIMDEAKQTVESQTISISYLDKNQLYKSYMSFVQNGALMIPSKKQYQLGDEVSLSIKLLDMPERFTIQGPVVWMTPTCAQGGRTAGIGVQLVDDEGKALRLKIETMLAGMLGSERKTDTM